MGDRLGMGFLDSIVLDGGSCLRIVWQSTLVVELLRVDTNLMKGNTK